MRWEETKSRDFRLWIIFPEWDLHLSTISRICSAKSFSLFTHIGLSVIFFIFTIFHIQRGLGGGDRCEHLPRHGGEDRHIRPQGLHPRGLPGNRWEKRQRWASTLANRSNARHRSNIRASPARPPQMYVSKVWESVARRGRKRFIASWGQDVTYLSLHPMPPPPSPPKGRQSSFCPPLKKGPINAFLSRVQTVAF